MERIRDTGPIETLLTVSLFAEVLFPIPGNHDLISATNGLDFSNVLDVGFGKGGASLYFALNGKEVDAIGLDTDSYDYPKALFSALNINVRETLFQDLQETKKYDAIWMSHVLEHTLDVGSCLQKAWRLLNDDGWLFILVPPYKNQVVGGHLSTGWNLGQMMYNLLLCGFDIKHGHFRKHGYNLCAFVRKSKRKLPKLRFDIGDIEATADLWPLEVKQGFNGDLESVNWFTEFEDIVKKQDAARKRDAENAQLKEKVALLEKSLKERSEQILKLQTESVTSKKQLEAQLSEAHQKHLSSLEHSLKNVNEELSSTKIEIKSLLEQREKAFTEITHLKHALENNTDKIKNISAAVKDFIREMGPRVQNSETNTLKTDGVDLLAQINSLIEHTRNQNKRFNTLQELVRKLGGKQ